MEDHDPAVDQQIGPVDLVTVAGEETRQLVHRGEEGNEKNELDDGQVDRPSRGRGECLSSPGLPTPQEVGDGGGHDQSGQGAGELAGRAPDESIGSEAGPGQGGQGEPGCDHGEGKDEIGDEIETTLFILFLAWANRTNDQGDDPAHHDHEDKNGQHFEAHAGSSHIWS